MLPCTSTYKKKRLTSALPYYSRAIYLSCFCAAYWGTAFAADANNPGWLPLKLSETLSNSLTQVSEHVLTRQGCESLIEAKVSENTDRENPKFIITCTNRQNQTLSFIYWQSDVENSFNTISYPEKTLDQSLDEEELFLLAQRKIREDNSHLITACQDSLIQQLSPRQLVLNQENIHITQRGELPAVVNMDYQVGEGEFAPKFTATCRRNSSEALGLSIFPRP